MTTHQSLRYLRKAALYVVGLTLVLAARGFHIERLVGGSYLWSSLAEDVLGLSLLMLAFHLLYYFVNQALARIESRGEENKTRKYWRAFSGLLRLAFVMIVVFPCLVCFIQIHPQKILPLKTPANFDLEFEEVELDSDGLKLSGWFIPASVAASDSTAKAANPTAAIVLAHGLNANKQNFLFPAKLFHELGYPVLIFDLRSHGASGGRTFTFGINEKADIKAAYDWMRARFPAAQIYGVGYSAGGAAMLQAAAKYKIFDKLILDSIFARLDRVAKGMFLRLFGPLDSLAWQMGRLWGKLLAGVDLESYDGERDIKKLNPAKVLLIHGSADRIIPHSESENLADATRAGGKGVELWIIEGANHLQGLGSAEYKARVGEFLGRLN